MFIQTESTPNPATLKFLPGRTVLASGTLDMPDRSEAAKSPLAEKLFEIPGVAGVFFGADFITVTKAGCEWQQIKPAILGAIMEHFMSGVPILHAAAGTASDADSEFFDTKDSETVAAMVTFVDGVPARNLYRKFKVRTVDNNDFAAMYEVLTRRFRRSGSTRSSP